MLTIDDIKKHVDYISLIKYDNEEAHAVEDTLYEEFITFVSIHAKGKLKEMAKEVLKTKDIKFDRWLE